MSAKKVSKLTTEARVEKKEEKSKSDSYFVILFKNKENEQTWKASFVQKIEDFDKGFKNAPQPVIIAAKKIIEINKATGDIEVTEE